MIIDFGMDWLKFRMGNRKYRARRVDGAMQLEEWKGDSPYVGRWERQGRANIGWNYAVELLEQGDGMDRW